MPVFVIHCVYNTFIIPYSIIKTHLNHNIVHPTNERRHLLLLEANCLILNGLSSVLNNEAKWPHHMAWSYQLTVLTVYLGFYIKDLAKTMNNKHLLKKIQKLTLKMTFAFGAWHCSHHDKIWIPCSSIACTQKWSLCCLIFKVIDNDPEQQWRFKEIFLKWPHESLSSLYLLQA